MPDAERRRGRAAAIVLLPHSKAPRTAPAPVVSKDGGCAAASANAGSLQARAAAPQSRVPVGSAAAAAVRWPFSTGALAQRHTHCIQL